jgi:Tol biopolymer transport system component
MYRYLLSGLSLSWFCVGLFIGAAILIGKLYDSPVLSFIAVNHDIADIYLYDLRTGLHHNLTRTSYPEWDMAWSHESGYLLYTATTAPGRTEDDFFVMFRLGQAERFDAAETLLAFGAVFAMDGQSIAYFSSHPHNYSDIYLFDLKQNQSYNLTRTPEQSEDAPQWSPDAQELLFLLDGNLYLMDMATSQESQLFLDLDDGMDSPQWSPDAQWIAFYTLRWQDGRYIRHLNVIASDGTDLRVLDLPDEPRTEAFSWSPDSQWIVLGLSSGELVIKHVSDEKTYILTGEDRRFAPVWSPDGQWIAFIENQTIHLLDFRKNEVYILNRPWRIRNPLHWMP